jgi:hypothetical protein
MFDSEAKVIENADFLARPKSKKRFVRFYPFRKSKEICEVTG